MVFIIGKAKTAVHKKTGNEYSIISEEVINCTNAQDEQQMVLYTRKGMLFVREKEEFEEKFVYVND